MLVMVMDLGKLLLVTRRRDNNFSLRTDTTSSRKYCLAVMKEPLRDLAGLGSEEKFDQFSVKFAVIANELTSQMKLQLVDELVEAGLVTTNFQDFRPNLIPVRHAKATQILEVVVI
jgi:hypothetical protein